MQNNIIHLFVPEMVEYGKNNKGGFLLVENEAGLEEYINEDKRMLKYSMTELIFGNQQIVVKILKNGCSLVVRQKEESFIEEKHDLGSLMKVVYEQKYEVEAIEVLQIHFNHSS